MSVVDVRELRSTSVTCGLGTPTTFVTTKPMQTSISRLQTNNSLYPPRLDRNHGSPIPLSCLYPLRSLTPTMSPYPMGYPLRSLTKTMSPYPMGSGLTRTPRRMALDDPRDREHQLPILDIEHLIKKWTISYRQSKPPSPLPTFCPPSHMACHFLRQSHS